MKRTSAVLTSHIVVQLFLTEKARLTFQKFQKFEVNSVDETCILALVRLDAKMTDAVDNFAESTAIMKRILHS